MGGGEGTERSRDSSPIKESNSDRDPTRFADKRSFLPFLRHRFVAMWHATWGCGCCTPIIISAPESDLDQNKQKTQQNPAKRKIFSPAASTNKTAPPCPEFLHATLIHRRGFEAPDSPTYARQQGETGQQG